MRAADADARGSITNIAVTMNTANRICIAYCSDAIIAPTCIVPWSMRWLPNQMIAMLVRFSITISAGIRNAISRFTAIAVLVRSRLAAIEPLALMRAAIERADHADAAQPFAEHEVQPVDLDLHRLRQRHRAAHDQPEDERHHRHHRDQHPRQLRVLRQRQDDAADRHHRRGDHHGQHHDQHLLHLRGVVGRPRDQRRRAEAVELVDREVLDAREDRAAQDPPESGGDLRREVAAGDGAERGDASTSAASGRRSRRIARWSPLTMPLSTMSDIRRGSSRDADRLRERQNQDDRDVAPVGLDETKQFQHGSADCSCPTVGVRFRFGDLRCRQRGRFSKTVASPAGVSAGARRACPAG